MHAEPPVLRQEFGVVAPARATGIGENKDALGVVHERLRLAEIAGGGAVLDDQAVDAVRACLADDAPRATRHLGHHVGAEALHDLVERAMNRRQRRQLFDQPIPARDGIATLDRLAVAINGPRAEIALAVGERLEKLRRE
jgi:hypothetical protein